MKRALTLLALGCLLPALLGCGRPGPALHLRAAVEPPEEDEPEAPEPAAPPIFARDVAPLLATYCLPCHNHRRARAGVVLDDFTDQTAGRNPALWQRVAGELRSFGMPPPGRPQPTPAERDTLNAWLDSVLPDDGPAGGKDRVTLRRLNRTEYNHTIRDLVGLDLRPADEFPPDDIGYGFDNVGDVLSMPPILFEKYLAAAEKVVDAAFRSDTFRRLLEPPPDDPALLPYRAVTYPVRETGKRLVLSAADVPPPDPATRELERAYEVLRAFADRAYRRPIRHDELMRLLHFVEAARRDGGGCEKGLRTALKAVLVSPHFLFRVGPPAGESDDFELAARLSYFLWGSMPDEELFRHAARRTLRHKRTLAAQVRRMLQDDRSRSLAEDFAGQWLQTRGLVDFTPDPGRFPDFDPALRAAMLRETELFFAAVVREDRSVLDFLDADFTFVNERLARHYGIPGVRGDHFRRVSLVGTARAGVLTHASVLAVTSNPTRTSPVKRGRWVLENILGAPVPPPPPGAGDLRDDRKAASGSLRQRMERHRADPRCSSCHSRMDPLGFGLENFDAVGAWRTREGGRPIDASGTLPGGQSFEGPAGLRAVLRGRRDAFARCLAEKMLTYALGRGLGRRDRRAVDGVVRKLARNDYRFWPLVLAVVQSEPFQGRGAKRGQP